VTRDGWILGRRTLTLHDAGAYARFSPYGVTKHAFHHTGAYTIPNVRFDGFVVFSNRVPTTAMRGFGVTSVSLATELHLNRVAEQVGMDPIELRLRNANRIGDTTGNRVVMHDPSTVAVTLAAADAAGYELGEEYRSMTSDRRTGDLLPEHLVAQQAPAGEHLATYDATPRRRRALMAKRRGRGFATIEYPTGMNQNGDPTQAWIKLKPDGSVDVFAGTVDIGQGSKTVHTQIVADALGVPYESVTMDNSNTDSSAVCTGTFASRGTFIGGNAVRFAAERVRERILDIASKELEISPDDLEISDGTVMAKGAPDRSISVGDVAGAATYQYGELISGQGHGAQAAGRGQRRRRLGDHRAALGDLLRRRASSTSRSTTRRARRRC
jgi:CO/xanthine dehydrogenase Mo-binding subunit